MSLQARGLLLLVRPTARASEWLAPVAGSLLAVAVDAFGARVSPSLGLTLAAIALALGVSFALDDAAAASIAASPTPLALRHAIRVACALPLPAAVWLGLVLHSQAVDEGESTLVLVGLVASALALAAIGSRAGESGGLVAAPALLALVACAFVLPARVSLFPEGEPGGAGPFVARWGLVLGLAASTFVAASRDPARRRVLTRRSGSARRPAAVERGCERCEDRHERDRPQERDEHRVLHRPRVD